MVQIIYSDNVISVDNMYESCKLYKMCGRVRYKSGSIRISMMKEWRDTAGRDEWPPVAVFFAGDQRLKHLLLECRKPGASLFVRNFSCRLKDASPSPPIPQSTPPPNPTPPQSPFPCKVFGVVFLF